MMCCNEVLVVQEGGNVETGNPAFETSPKRLPSLCDQLFCRDL